MDGNLSGTRKAGRLPAKWTRQSLVKELQALHQREFPLTIKANKRLAKAAMRLFGSWNQSLAAAGLPTRRFTRWTRESLLVTIQRAHLAGLFDNTHWIADRRIASAARRCFGSWRRALVEAGVLTPDATMRRRSKWSRQQVIEIIQDRFIRRQPVLSKEDRSLEWPISKYFSSRHAARVAAGIAVAKRPRRRRQWNREKVIQEIQALRDRGQSLTDLAKAGPGLAAAARRYFGSRHAALVAANVRPSTFAPRVPQKWSKQRVLTEIQDRYRRGASLSYGCRDNRHLVSAAHSHIGKWSDALLAAGVPSSRQSSTYRRGSTA